MCVRRRGIREDVRRVLMSVVMSTEIAGSRIKRIVKCSDRTTCFDGS